MPGVHKIGYCCYGQLTHTHHIPSHTTHTHTHTHTFTYTHPLHTHPHCHTPPDIHGGGDRGLPGVPGDRGVGSGGMGPPQEWLRDELLGWL